jgi:hypothetical protein
MNIQGLLDGMETELYDVGASRHMSPYRYQFLNYVPIMPKSITAADKRYFQAIGKGDMRIRVPNGKETTWILLKDVLYCPDMGLTLVSVSRAAAAGYPAFFRGNMCRIFDKKNRVVGEIPVTNGLYRVDHDEISGAMGAVTKELLTVEELHRRTRSQKK